MVMPESGRWGTQRFGDDLGLRVLVLAIALVAGIGCGMFDLVTGRTVLTALFVSAASFALALVRPRYALISASIVALGIPTVYFISMAAGATIPYPPAPNAAVTLLALIPALGAAGLALLVHRSLRSTV